jgi:hypothetical protein
MFDFITDGFNAILDFFVDIFGGIYDFFAFIFANIFAAFQWLINLPQFIYDSVVGLWQGFSDWVSAELEWWSVFWTAFYDNFWEYLSDWLWEILIWMFISDSGAIVLILLIIGLLFIPGALQGIRQFLMFSRVGHIITFLVFARIFVSLYPIIVNLLAAGLAALIGMVFEGNDIQRPEFLVDVDTIIQFWLGFSIAQLTTVALCFGCFRLMIVIMRWFLDAMRDALLRA